MSDDYAKLKAQLEKANSLLARIVDGAEVEVDTDGEVIDDSEAIISDELFQEALEYCSDYGIEYSAEESSEENQSVND